MKADKPAPPRRASRISITGRLILALTLGTAVFWSVAAVATTYVFNEELNETFDLALRETAQRLLPLAIDDLAERDHHEPRALAHSLTHSVEYLNYQVSDASGQVLLRTPETINPPADLYAGAAAPGFRTVGEYRTYSIADPQVGITLTVAETIGHRREAIDDVTRTLFWPLVLLVPLSMLGIWLAVSRTLAPVRRLSAEIAQRDSNNLTPIDVGDQPIELKPMAEAIGRLIERLKAALDAERAFAANSAHELRTPIAGALAQTQMLLTELGAGPSAVRAGEIERALQRLAGLSEKLLQISRVDAGLGASNAANDLLPVLDLVIKDSRAELTDPARLHYTRESHTELTAHMDMDAFAIAMRNLIDNALKHGPSDQNIEVAVGPGLSVAIRNGGPTVPEAELDGLKGRFRRGSTDATGAGLGLAIVETIMRQSNGRLELTSPIPGRLDGFEARLVFTR
jgi:two-component system OmpR family sensor kinase